MVANEPKAPRGAGQDILYLDFDGALHHDDLADQFREGVSKRDFDAIGVNYCAITNGLGERVLEGQKGW